MARTVKLAPTEHSAPKARQVVAPSRLALIRNNLPTIVGAAALVAAGALAGTALAHGGPDGRDGRHPGGGMEARMQMRGDHGDAGKKPGGMGGPGGKHAGDRTQGEAGPRHGADLTGTITSTSSTSLTMKLADGTSATIVLDGTSQYFTQTVGSAADVAVGSTVLVKAGMPVGNAAPAVTGIAVLASGLTNAHIHLGHPAKVTAVSGSTITLEVTTRRGTENRTVTISAATTISKIYAATNTDLTVGGSVVVDLGRGTSAAESVLIVK